jgi:hypothetical protein
MLLTNKRNLADGADAQLLFLIFRTLDRFKASSSITSDSFLSNFSDKMFFLVSANNPEGVDTYDQPSSSIFWTPD